MNALRILFATVARLRQEASGPTSDLASARYRVILPAQQLARAGHAVQIASLPETGWPEPILRAECDVVVISKSFHAQNETLALAMKERGVKVAVDFCDDHFDDPRFGAHYRRLAELADIVIAGSEAMAASIARHVQRDALVVSDPVEGPRGEPRFEPLLSRLRIAWFGHPSNFPALAARVDELKSLALRYPVRLSIVTQALPEIAAFTVSLGAMSDGCIACELVPWSRDATWQVLAASDAVWIPVEAGGTKAVKSPNRLLESAWAGRFVVSGTLPSYEPWSDVLAVGRPLDEALAAALQDPAGTRARIDAAQRRIERDHSGLACARAWARALGDESAAPLIAGRKPQ